MSLLARFEEKFIPEPNTGCWLWFGASRSGDGRYGSIGVGRRPRAAHQVAYELFVGPIPKGAHVLHRCDVDKCVNPEHLYLGDHTQNMADKARRGRSADVRGERNPRAKLSARQVAEIRRRRAGGERLKSLSKAYGVTMTQISYVARGKGWAR